MSVDVDDIVALGGDFHPTTLLSAYERAKGVKAETARLLGIKPSALYYKLEKYGIGGKPEEET